MVQQLFQIELFHGWFKHGKFEDCQIIPDATTQELLARYRLMTQMRQAKFELYSVFQANTEALLNALARFLDGTALRFLLQYTPEKFNYMTDFPFNWVGKNYFSSKNIENNNSNDKINLIPTLQSDLAPMVTPVFFQNNTFEENVIAEIAIFPDDLLLANAKSVQYFIHFNARVTRWFYYLINRSQTKLNKPLISNADGLCFNEPETIVMPNGETALGFSSGDLQFPLQQVPTTCFNLMDRLTPLMQTSNQAIQHCLIKSLPTPKPGQLVMKQAGASSFIFSEMYIHL